MSEENDFQTFPDERPYTPSTAELAVVEALQRNGAPTQVQYVAADGIGRGFPGWTVHLIRFIGRGRKYEADSFRVVAWPQISYYEMKALGMISEY